MDIFFEKSNLSNGVKFKELFFSQVYHEVNSDKLHFFAKNDLQKHFANCRRLEQAPSCPTCNKPVDPCSPGLEDMKFHVYSGSLQNLWKKGLQLGLIYTTALCLMMTAFQTAEVASSHFRSIKIPIYILMMGASLMGARSLTKTIKASRSNPFFNRMWNFVQRKTNLERLVIGASFFQGMSIVTMSLIGVRAMCTSNSIGSKILNWI